MEVPEDLVVEAYEEDLPAVPEILVVPPLTRDAAAADLVAVPEVPPVA